MLNKLSIKLNRPFQIIQELDPLISENYDIINNITDNPQEYILNFYI